MDNEFLYLLMELADYSLQTHLEKRNKLSVNETILIIQHVVSALIYLHEEENQIHRDIKPGNLLWVEKDQRWKVSDLGLVTELTQSSVALTSRGLGTIAYMPPEAFQPNPEGKTAVSAGWDLWALGVMILVMLTGELPYRLGSEPEMIGQVANYQIRIPERLPAPLDQIVKGCLMQDRKQRWSAKQVLGALQPKVSSSGSSPQPANPKPSSLRSTTTGVDYTDLDRALRNRQWQEADDLTFTLMCDAAGRTKEGYLNQKSIERFPCEDLKLIDDLWVQHSNGKLGFSVQKRIWEEVGCPGSDYHKHKAKWLEFGRRVNWQGGSGSDNWRYYHQLEWSDPQKYSGHLPAKCAIRFLARRLVDCSR